MIEAIKERKHIKKKEKNFILLFHFYGLQVQRS